MTLSQTDSSARAAARRRVAEIIEETRGSLADYRRRRPHRAGAAGSSADPIADPFTAPVDDARAAAATDRPVDDARLAAATDRPIDDARSAAATDRPVDDARSPAATDRPAPSSGWQRGAGRALLQRFAEERAARQHQMVASRADRHDGSDDSPERIDDDAVLALETDPQTGLDDAPEDNAEDYRGDGDARALITQAGVDADAGGSVALAAPASPCTADDPLDSVAASILTTGSTVTLLPDLERIERAVEGILQNDPDGYPNAEADAVVGILEQALASDEMAEAVPLPEFDPPDDMPDDMPDDALDDGPENAAGEPSPEASLEQALSDAAWVDEVLAAVSAHDAPAAAIDAGADWADDAAPLFAPDDDDADGDVVAQPIEALPARPVPAEFPDDDLAQIGGVGPGMVKRLRLCGITRISELALIESQALRDKLGDVARLANVDAWISRANHMIDSLESEVAP